MALPRFFCPIPLANNSLIDLPAEAAHHAGRALRLREGVRISLFNGNGGEYQGFLRFNNGVAQAEIDTFIADNRTLPGHITLIQALAAGDKMDWIIEKAVEIGVTRFIPVAAERSVLQLSGNRLEKRQQHWQAIVQSACEQSGRNILMELWPVQRLEAACKLLSKNFLSTSSITIPQATIEKQTNLSSSSTVDTATCETTSSLQLFIADPEGEQSLTDYLRQNTAFDNIGFFVGPEGGWSDKEMRLMSQYHAHKVRFGERVLRTETAGLALSSASAALLGWL